MGPLMARKRWAGSRASTVLAVGVALESSGWPPWCAPRWGWPHWNREITGVKNDKVTHLATSCHEKGLSFCGIFAAKNFFNTKDIVRLLCHNLSFVQCSWCENNIGFRLELSQVRPPEHSCFRHWLSIQPQRRLHGLLGLPICQGASLRLRIGQQKKIVVGLFRARAVATAWIWTLQCWCCPRSKAYKQLPGSVQLTVADITVGLLLFKKNAGMPGEWARLANGFQLTWPDAIHGV